MSPLVSGLPWADAPRLTCRDFIAGLDDFVAGALDRRRTCRFRDHAERCRACARYLKAYIISLVALRAVR